jgi:hypothetical protein
MALLVNKLRGMSSTDDDGKKAFTILVVASFIAYVFGLVLEQTPSHDDQVVFIAAALLSFCGMWFLQEEPLPVVLALGVVLCLNFLVFAGPAMMLLPSFLAFEFVCVLMAACAVRLVKRTFSKDKTL